MYKTFLIQDGPAIELTAASKKKISSIAIFLGVSTHIYIYTPTIARLHLLLQDEENDDGPAIPVNPYTMLHIYKYMYNE